MLRISQIKVPAGSQNDISAIEKKLSKIVKASDLKAFNVVRKALDARKAPELYWIYTVDAEVIGESRYLKSGSPDISKPPIRFNPVINDAPGGPRPIVIGFGPAGIFAAYILALNNMRPIVFERGFEIERRKTSVDKFWNTGSLCTTSNVQFGEGGAGAFSDGKLNTSVKDKDGMGRFILETFVKHGANPDILIDAKPHVGTDRLAVIIPKIRKEIEALGGEVHFESQVTEFLYESDRITGVVVNGNEKYKSDCVVSAIGHSARDTFTYLDKINIPMIAKEFAVGFRVEHPQSVIDDALYKGAQNDCKLPPAAYKLTHQTQSKRGVYSFCMCPGGYVVNASSYDGGTVVNGMSYMARDSKTANSAIVVSVGEKDFGSATPLAGMQFQEKIEKKCFSLAPGRVPRQLLGDFRKGVASTSYRGFEGALKGLGEFCDLSALYDTDITSAFLEGMHSFDKQIKGFNDDNVILSGIESRTSSPVRILRNDALEASLKGLYPCGEGAGYAGGIMSAAMDGIKVAKKILESRK